MGFEPIEYTNFDRINIVNALPWVKAVLEDHLVIDKNGNGKADPGDTLEVRGHDHKRWSGRRPRPAV